MIPVQLVNGGVGQANKACITEYGQIVTAPVSYDSSAVQTFDVASTGYNLIEPLPGKEIVITGLTAYANRNVSNTIEATVEIYEADSVDTATVSKAILTIPLLKQQSVVLNPLNFKVTEGRWVNGKTDDDDIIVTVFYYYIDKG